MSAPLPEVPPLAPRPPTKSAPLSLSLMLGLGVMLNLLSLFFYTPALGELGLSPAVERMVAFGIMLLLGIGPLILLWLGLNWARWVFTVITVLSYATLFMGEMPPQNAAQETLNWAHLLYDACLLVFLWTPAMRAHFTSRKKVEQ